MGTPGIFHKEGIEKPKDEQELQKIQRVIKAVRERETQGETTTQSKWPETEQKSRGLFEDH